MPKNGSVLLKLALPESHDTEPQGAKCHGGCTVAALVGFYLRSPEIGASARYGRSLAVSMAVPEAAVHKDCEAVFWQHEVWPTGQISSMEAKAVSCAVEQPSHAKLGRRVLTPDLGHVLATRRWAELVGH